MGRKSRIKQDSKQKPEKGVNKFVIQKRKELSVLVENLLKLTSTIQPTSNVSKSWDHHLEIETLLKEIRKDEDILFMTQNDSSRESNINKFVDWLTKHEAQFEGVEISEFEGYDLGLKATKPFKEGSLVLTIPQKLMLSVNNAENSELKELIAVDPLLQNMPNITLALFLLLEKSKSDSFWKAYIDILPQTYTTILYFTPEELAELKPSPVFESSLKLFRSIARQYAYFYNVIQTLELPAMKQLGNIFTFENYRWAVSTVMTRQNIIRLNDVDTTAFIPLWDMCNHEQGKLTTDFNTEKGRGECYAQRDFSAGEQIFIFYGARPNADLFLHNGFVYSDNPYDSLTLTVCLNLADPLKEKKLAALNDLRLSNATKCVLHKSGPINVELLPAIRIYNMNQGELDQLSNKEYQADLQSAKAMSCDRKSYAELLTRCELMKKLYALHGDGKMMDTIHRRNVKSLKDSEVQTLDCAIEYLKSMIGNVSTQ